MIKVYCSNIVGLCYAYSMGNVVSLDNMLLLKTGLTPKKRKKAVNKKEKLMNYEAPKP